MVRRPLIYLLLAFVIGSLFYQVPLFGVVGVVLVLVFACYVSWHKFSKNRHDQIMLVVPILFFLGYYSMSMAMQDAPLESFLQSAPKSCTIIGTIDQISKTKSSNKIVLKEVEYLDFKGELGQTETAIAIDSCIVYVSEVAGLHIGNQIEVKGKLSLLTEPTNLGQFDEKSYYKTMGISYKMMASSTKVANDSTSLIKDSLYSLRCRIKSVYEKVLDEEMANNLKAMLLGEKAEVSSEVKDLYQVGGISHILAISGLHITLLGMAIHNVLQRLFGVKTAIVGTVLFVILYGIFTNFSVSTNRAVVMMIVLLFGKWLGRTYDLLSALSLSGLLILMREPLQLFQSGFLLSFGAVVGIGIVYPALAGCFEKKTEEKQEDKSLLKRGLQALRKNFLFFLSIQLVTLPIMLSSFYEIATYGFFVNLFVLPLMSLVVGFGLVGGIIGCFSTLIATPFLFLASLILEGYQKVCELVYCLPNFYIVLGKPELLILLFYLVLLILGCIFLYRMKKRGAVCFMLAILLLLLPTKREYLTITMLDIGQGDCLVVTSPSGANYLIDAGSSSVNEMAKYRLVPYLKASRITTLDYVFVSHADDDHISGMKELLETSLAREIHIGTLVLPETSYEDEGLEVLITLAKQAEVMVRYMEQGGKVVEGDLSFTCLHPSYEERVSSANGYSMVLGVAYREFSMLFTGDVEEEGEKYMRKQGDLATYDVLKVGHHGSKSSSSTDFLDEVSPRIALISCGVNNRYGHPHASTLERLKERGVKTYITTESGMITIRTDGEEIEVREFVGAD